MLRGAPHNQAYFARTSGELARHAALACATVTDIFLTDVGLYQSCLDGHATIVARPRQSWASYMISCTVGHIAC